MFQLLKYFDNFDNFTSHSVKIKFGHDEEQFTQGRVPCHAKQWPTPPSPHLHPTKCQSIQEAITYALNSLGNIGIILLTHLLAPNAWRPLVLIFWDILKMVSLGVGAYP